MLAGARPIALAVLWLSGAAVFLSVVSEHYFVKEWLFWSYAGYCLASAYVSVACWAAGDRVVRFIAPGLPASERVAASFAAGLYVFFLGMFAGGLAGLYGTTFFYLWPALMALFGGAGFFRFGTRLFRHSVARYRRFPPPLSGYVPALFGLAGLCMVYFAILSPENIAYDSRWYHLAIAEHYVAEGSVRAFAEGWFPGALPHLGSFIYVWAFLLPGGDTWGRVELAAHLEFAILLWTLGGISVLARACTRRARHLLQMERGGRRGIARSSGLSTWAALFLFPGIFVYDSAVSGAADHIAAFWAAPALLGVFRWYRTPGVRSGVLLTVPLSGVLLTKYQGIYLVAFPVLCVIARSIWVVLTGFGSRRAHRNAVLGATAAAALGGLVLTAPHWLANLLWYGDPLYPNLHHFITVRPWTLDSGLRYDLMFAGGWAPVGTTTAKLKETLKALATFSFQPHDWLGFHRDIPVFGSLFTLSLVPLLFLRRTARLWVVTLATYLGVFIWYWTFHQDRYLQMLVPPMAVVAGSVLQLSWESGWLPRVAVSILVALQVIWGGDAYFLPTHAMTHHAAAATSADTLSAASQGRLAQRRKVFGLLPTLAADLPPGSKLLIHDTHDHLGVRVPSVSDWGPWQGGISYGRSRSPRALYDQLRGYGVTHVLWSTSKEQDSLAGDLVFFAFIDRYVDRERSAGVWNRGVLSRTPPPDTAWARAPTAVFVCSEGYEAGLYELGDLTSNTAGPRHVALPKRTATTLDEIESALAESQFVAVEPACKKVPDMGARTGFHRVGSRGRINLWIRKDLK